ARPALRRFGIEAAVQETANAARKPRGIEPGWTLHDLAPQLLTADAAIRPLAGECLPERHAVRELGGRRREGAAAPLLGGHVGRRAEQLARGRDRVEWARRVDRQRDVERRRDVSAGLAREAEVGDDDPPVAAAQHVVRLE